MINTGFQFSSLLQVNRPLEQWHLFIPACIFPGVCHQTGFCYTVFAHAAERELAQEKKGWSFPADEAAYRQWSIEGGCMRTPLQRSDKILKTRVHWLQALILTFVGVLLFTHRHTAIKYAFTNTLHSLAILIGREPVKWPVLNGKHRLAVLCQAQHAIRTTCMLCPYMDIL